MTNLYLEHISQYRDVESLNAYSLMLEQGMSEEQVIRILQQKSRDNARSPVQWSDEPNAGFTTGTPWLDVASNYKTINVEDALRDPQSIFYTYQQLIKLRHNLDIMTYGEVVPELVEHPQLFAYRRVLDDQTITVVANFSGQEVDMPDGLATDGEVLMNNYHLIERRLKPYQAVAVLS